MGKLAGQVALVTGSAIGMGKAHAERLAQEGAALVLQDIDGTRLEATATELRAKGAEVHTIASDISDGPATSAAIEKVHAALGHIDILINNAGIFDHFGPIEDIPFDAWERMFDVHVKGSFVATKAVVPGMKQRRRGKIINISSVFGMVGSASHSHYCGAKGALLAMTKAWAKELAPSNIMVNAIAPGGVWTELSIAEMGGVEKVREREKTVPLKRWAQPEEIAHLALFLACHESDFITGQVVSPNGGSYIVGI
ncbi:MAG: SDR family NAD(P)-dependent oxidoreductase [Hyphomicrobiaceae bacterium]